MHTTYTHTQWLAFLALPDPTILPTETIEDMTAAAQSPDWTGGPVESLLPEVVPEFAAISTRLGDAYREHPSKQERQYAKTVPALFRIGCHFGDMMEQVQEAREADDLDAERLAHGQLRGVWAAMLAFIEDYK